MEQDKEILCPFCGWKSRTGEYEMLIHIETLHSEDPSPFVAQEDQTSGATITDEDPAYVECPIEDCGEILLLSDLDYHLELHEQEAAGSAEHLAEESIPASSEQKQDATSAQTLHTSSHSASPKPHHREGGHHHKREHKSPKSERQASAISFWKNLLRMPGSSSSNHRHNSKKRRHEKTHTEDGSAATRLIKRLGTAQLGKYAHEERMPDWLVNLLKREGQVVAKGVIPVITKLLEQSPSVKYAYLCHPCVQHVSKLKKEGGFCGYRNIQMVCSFVIEKRMKGHETFGGKLPSIFQIQDYIEGAWDHGINVQGRIETGGIRGTRKYIGTPEALAMFRYLNIPCEARAIKNKDSAKAEAELMDFVEQYFQSGVLDPTQRVRRTNLPPIYFQHVGHSLTIIGFERLKSGSKNLLVFDPSFHDASYITRLTNVEGEWRHPLPDMALRPYRRGTRYLKNFREFELLRLRPDSE